MDIVCGCPATGPHRHKHGRKALRPLSAKYSERRSNEDNANAGDYVTGNFNQATGGCRARKIACHVARRP
jgi:hypothetical protein